MKLKKHKKSRVDIYPPSFRPLNFHILIYSSEINKYEAYGKQSFLMVPLSISSKQLKNSLNFTFSILIRYYPLSHNCILKQNN